MLVCRYGGISPTQGKENSAFAGPAAAHATVRRKSEAAFSFDSEREAAACFGAFGFLSFVAPGRAAAAINGAAV